MYEGHSRYVRHVCELFDPTIVVSLVDPTNVSETMRKVFLAFWQRTLAELLGISGIFEVLDTFHHYSGICKNNYAGAICAF